ncbi:MAG TPA: hypothetical protein VJM31_06965 [Vicinamibacterales bacterium]|nr:hypothetical protein [Vicinamibacterales bacterium]
MKVRIIREPAGATVEASLNYYRPGEVYDIPANLAEYLVMEEFAIFEMRERDRPPVPVAVERRTKN